MGERETLANRITAYLQGGGLFNPEAANHDAVRDLLIDCRAALAPAPAEAVAHRWERCEFCGPMVVCGKCGNNCCNGGSGEQCPDKCASAYAEQTAGWERMNRPVAHPAPARGEAVREFSEAEVDAARRIVVVFTDERPDDDQSTVTWGDALLLAKAVERLARPDRERGT